MLFERNYTTARKDSVSDNGSRLASLDPARRQPPGGWRRFWLTPLRLTAACRILCYPSKLKRLWSLNFMNRYFAGQPKRDRFFFLTHDYYLSRCFTVAQRVDCAISHYSFESLHYGSAYHHSVYHSPRGLELWRRVIGDTVFTVRLCATEDNRHEGDLSVLCLVNDARVCRLSFTYVNGAEFRLRPGSTMFVTRNQTDRGPDLQLFRDSFKHNSPTYFCLAAVCGIAMANGIRVICMIKDEAQIAYAEQYAESFRNSYSAFWEAFGAEEIGGLCAYRMAIPLGLSALSDVKHKNRAVARRRNWLEVALSARQAMLAGRTSEVPPPIEGAAYALLPPVD
jgi:uncharacterized protein VirK/YbjX